MFFATSEELNKVATMKLTITGFMTKLENFINETNATDDNLLRLFSNVTDLIQGFNLTAKVIKTNHTIESIVDKQIWTCENIFKCLACNFETGKTYISVLEHVKSSTHIAQEMLLKNQKENTIAITTTPSNAINSLPQFPANREFGMNRSQSHNPYPLSSYRLSNIHQEPVTSPHHTLQRQMLARRTVGRSHEYNPIQGHSFKNFGTNNNNTLVKPFLKNFNHMPSLHHFQNYSQHFQMPLPTNVIGFQQNRNSPSNNYRRNFNQTNLESKQPPVEKRRLSKRIERRAEVINSNDEDVDLRLLHPDAISFLRGNFENDVEEFINAAKEISSDDLYTNIKTNLTDCCRELNVNAEITCFGSRITGIASKKSTINLNISAANSSQTAESFLQKLLTILYKSPNWKYVKYFKSHLPRIRAFHFNERMHCDVTFNNEIAMASTKLIKYFYRIQPECRKLVVFVKLLIHNSKLNPRFNNYTINLLVFFYLQSDGHLPKVVDLIQTSSLEHSPNEFTEKTLEELNLKEIKTFNELCIGFVKFYYYQVDFKYDVLSIFTGTKIPKSQLSTTECGTKTFGRCMCVQDPFRHEHNAGEYFGKYTLMRFIECCGTTYNVLHVQSVRENDSS